MNNLCIFLCWMSCMPILAAQPRHLYLIPGQGSDERIFKNWSMDSSNWIVHYVHHSIPPRGCNMHAYAQLLATQIDTTQPFFLTGISLGGMVATEMATFLHPEAVVIVSSAQCRHEIPGRYRWMKAIPFWKIIPAPLYKYGSLIAQPLVEPDRRRENATCKAMLLAKAPLFLKRATGLIANWEKQDCGNAVIRHLHGDNDHTLPVKNIQADLVLHDGSHMMALTRGREVWPIVEALLLQ